MSGDETDTAGTGAEDAEVGGFDARSLRPAARPLDEDKLDELAARIPKLAEPVAALAVGIEVARADGDHTGVRKRLFELGIGLVRYSVSVGLAALAAKLGGATAPRPLAEALGRAARMSDGQWCDLARTVAGALRAVDPSIAAALAFTSQKPLAELVTARNDFIHRSGPGDNALDKLWAVLEGARPLLAMPVRAIVALEPPSFEARMGTPVRAGVWRKTQGELPPGLHPGEVYLVPPASGQSAAWIAMSSFLPLVDKRLVLIDAPHAPGKPWRWSDPETGEHREHAGVDKAIRQIVGEDKNAPRELTDRPGLVGREAAVKVLARAAEGAHQFGVRVVLLTGPFGIGRSRLAQAVGEAAAGLGFGRVIDMSCSEERRSPLRSLRLAIDGLPGMGRVSEAIMRALSADSNVTRSGLDVWLEAIEEALLEASQEEPTILSVDDAQWADEHTLSLLSMLTERARKKVRAKLLIVATVRDEPHPSPALRRFIGQVEKDIGSAATRVALETLAAGEAAKLVHGVAPIAPEIEKAVVAGAGGVPFFLVQPLLVWNETGQLVWRDAAWRPRDVAILNASFPGVKDLLRARLGSFFDPGSDAERAAQHVLACVALYGDGLPIARLTAATEAAGTSALAAEQALETLLEAGLLVVRGELQEYGFAQAIIRKAVLEDLRARAWFRRIHRALLDAVAASDHAVADASFLATGYDVLGARDEAAVWFARGVHAALARGVFNQAIELAERLAVMGRNADERTRAELWIVDAMLRAGRAADARARLESIKIEAASDPKVALEARVLALSLATILHHLPTDHDAGIIADADDCGDLTLRIESRLAVAWLVRGRRGLAAVEQAIQLAPSEWRDLRYRALAARFSLLLEVETDEKQLQRAVSAVREAAREVGSVWAELDADNCLAVAQSNAGDFAGAIQLFEGIAARAKELKFGTLHREVLINIATCYLRDGKPAEAAARARAASEDARAAGDVNLLSGAQSVRADALMRTGDLSGARAAIDEAVDNTLAGSDYRTTLALLRRVEICEKTGELELAGKDAELAREIAQQGSNIDHATRAAIWLAIRDVRCGKPDAAVHLRDLLARSSEVESALRAPTKRLLLQARELLGAV